MIPEERSPQIHHQTARGARNALAHRLISQESYRAVLRGELSLADAKSLGRDRGPDTPEDSSGPGTATEIPGRASAEDNQGGADMLPQPVSRISKDDRTRTCMCGCGRETRGRFAMGHDQAMFRVAREHLEEGQELTGDQREYLESSGKMERVRARLAEEERKAKAKDK
jgi:hypothetical protein